MRACIARFKEQLPALSNLIDRIEKAGKAAGYLLAVDSRWGRIRAKDGELLVHTMLNVLLQMTGSLCMKWGLYLALPELDAIASGELAALLANVHDEVQMEVEEDEVLTHEYSVTGHETEKEAWKAEEKRVHKDDLGFWSAPHKLGWDEDTKTLKCSRDFHKAGDVLCRNFEAAGRYLGIRVPLAGEYKIGDSWGDTH